MSTTAERPDVRGVDAPARPPRRRRSRTGSTILRYVVLVLLALVFVSPLVFMLVTSFKTRVEAGGIPPSWIPNPFTLQAYQAILGNDTTPVLRWFFNSILTATAYALLVVTTAALAAYPLARMEFRGKNFVFGAIVATLFIPPVILIIPNYLCLLYTSPSPRD